MANFIDFKVGAMKIGKIDTSSGVFSGENLQYGWLSSSKSNLSMGKIVGDTNYLEGSQNVIADADMIDTWIKKARPFDEQLPPSPLLARHWHRRKKYNKRYRTNSHLDWDWHA